MKNGSTAFIGFMLFLMMLFGNSGSCTTALKLSVVDASFKDHATYEKSAVAWGKRARLPDPCTATCEANRCTVSAGETPTLYAVVCRDNDNGCHMTNDGSDNVYGTGVKQ